MFIHYTDCSTRFSLLIQIVTFDPQLTWQNVSDHALYA
jgi:hypothetical protein